jgi:hypothetical protein
LKGVKKMLNSRANVFAAHRVGVKRLGFIGAATSQQEIAAGSAAAGVAAGAAYGSVVPGIGTAVGAAVGLIASFLVHTGQGAQRLSQAQAIDSALSSITTANHQGAAIPWNGTASSPGLEQFISALMTAGIYMSWDPSVESSPSVNGNWSVCFMNAVIAVTKAIVNGATGASLTVPIVISGESGSPTRQFTFTNPGISVGPDVISANIIMGNGGLMYWIILGLGETAAHASANGSNTAAQKVFALMVDHAAYDATPVPAPTPIATPVATPTAVASIQPIVAAPVAASTGTATPTQTGTTASGSPVVAPGDESALIAQLIAQGQSQTAAITAAIQSMQANNIPVTPQAQAQLQAVAASAPSGGLFGLSSTTLLLLLGGSLAAFLLLKD